MTKPLELTLYPPLSPAVQEAVDWNIEHGWPTYEGFGVEENVPGITAIHAKRLKEPELAAEWWRHHATFDQLTEGYGVESFGTDYICGGAHEDRARDQLNTLHRFATSPHYCEESA